MTTEIDPGIQDWLDARRVIAEALGEMGVEGRLEEKAAAVIARLSYHEPPLHIAGRVQLGNEEEMDLLQLAWGVIANAGGGSWGNESDEWRQAAESWREKYHELLDRRIP